MEEMRAFSTQTTRAIQKDVAAMFTPTGIGAFVGVALAIAQFKEIVQEAHEIHAESEKFRLDAQNLQTIGNVAKELGIPLTSVARAMNYLEVSSYQATQADNQQRAALQGLGIDANAFFQLNSEQKFLALATAYQNASDKGAAYAQIMELIGRRSAEAIRIIQQGPEAIKAQGDAMLKFSPTALAQLDALRVQFVGFWNFISRGFANVFSEVSADFNIGIYAIVQGLAAAGDTFSGFFAMLGKAAHLDFTGAKQAWDDWQARAVADIDKVAAEAERQHGKVQDAITPSQRTTEEGGVSPSAPGSSGLGSPGQSAADVTKDLKEQVDLSDKLANIQRDNAASRLSDGGKLAALQRELVALQNQELTLQGGTVEQAQNLVDQAQKQGDIDKLNDKIHQDDLNYQDQAAKVRQQMADQANQELADSQQQTKELQLQLVGRKDLADRSRIEYDYNTKIHDAQNAITEAQKQGFTEVENTNRQLVTQLNLEKQAALAAHDKAVGEEMAAKAAAEKANVEAEKENLDDLKQQAQIQELVNSKLTQAARELKIQNDYQAKIKQALNDANDLWTKMAAAYAQGNKSLGDEYAQHALVKQQEADELELLKQQVLLAERMLEIEQAQKDTLAAGIQLDVLRGNIDSQTAQYEQQSLDMQYKSLDLQTKIDDAYATGNTLLAQQLQIEKQITDQQAEQARNEAFANQLRTQGVVVGQPGTDALGRMAAEGLSMGATPSTLAAAMAHFQGLSPAQAAQLSLRLQAQQELRNLQGQNLDWFTQLQDDKLVQAYAQYQQQQADQASALAHQQQIDYWGAIAAGRVPPASNPYTGQFGVPNFATGQFQPLSGDSLTAYLTSELQNWGLSQTQIVTLLQQIASNTKTVTV
jgi:hypothetical protein